MMKREIKFRAWDKYQQEMKPWSHMRRMPYNQKFNAIASDDVGAFLDMFNDETLVLMQFTGLKDKNGVEIYEGDIILHRRPARSYQDHYGPNIPGPTGHYREPLEPEIAKENLKVYFKDGCFMVRDDCPLMWLPNTYTHAEAVDGFEADIKYWNDPKEGDLSYLLAEYGFDSEASMIDSLGSTIIGNIYQNPELLNKQN